MIAARTLIAATSGEIVSDFQGHFQAILNENDLFNLLYSPFYLAQNSILVDRSVSTALLAGLTVMALMYALKGFIVTFFALNSDYPLIVSLFFACCLIVAMPFPRLGADEWFYLGTLSPNVFHNATQVLANALAIPAVYCLTVWARTPTKSWTLAMAVSGALASLAKPALTPAWVVTFSALLIWKVAKGQVILRRAVLTSLVSLPIPLIMLLSGVFVFRLFGQQASTTWTVRSGVAWSFFVDSIPLALLRSWAFPISVLLTCGLLSGLGIVYRRLLVPWMVAVSSALIFWLLVPLVNGQIDSQGNLAWGGIAASSALYVMSFLALSRSGIRFVFQLPALGVLVIQAWGGLRYLDQWLETGTFL